ncbi:Paf1-domain-containing protein [Westerdykella ornata]|uniref:Paf1-domain-containing protein n=1 Tax=Westerdykella ornata TaxID=318751 RepID=A0A6A6JVD6_WESOR|nr:Paf1-domain-containing protein [Westerdykella ornata]KAF2280184.1 Paf1-domain-containing protein [Westerdykella ornata]
MADRPRQTIHQDYIARIRYSNALPPPPCPPKLLDIPNTGLSSGLYTSANFANRLVREQPLNIEADAELGMPIDLVGIPGVFDGDESAIQAMEKAPPLHPADRALMRPPNALGKASSAVASGISFLRRTEYTTAFTTGGSKFESSTSSNTMRLKAKRRRADLSQDDPLNIAKHIQKGFDLAYPADAHTGVDTEDKLRAAQIAPEEKQAWRNPKHPSKPNLTLLDSYPLLPDWDAVPDTGSYMIYRFAAPPVKDTESGYDERLDVAILRPMGESIDDHETYLAEVQRHKEDPTLPLPLPRYHFEFFLPADKDKDKVRGIKRNFSTFDPDNEDEIPFDQGVDDEGRPRKFFKYENIRTYDTHNQSGDPNDTYGNVVALALHDPETHPAPRLRATKLQKAAYFYPISQRTVIKPKRPGKLELLDGEYTRVDVIEAVGRDPAQEAEKRTEIRRRYDVLET